MARRVNKRFLVTAAISATALVGAVLLADKLLIQQHPDQYVAIAHEAERSNRWSDAVSALNSAVSISPSNADLWVELGDAYHQLGLTDPEVMLKDRAAWDRAVALDPKNLGALKRLLHQAQEIAQLQPRAASFQAVHDLATKAHDVDPNDSQIEAEMLIAPVQAWLVGVDTEPGRIEDALKDVQRLIASQPTDIDPAYFVALARIKLGRGYAEQGDDLKAADSYASAVSVIDAAVQKLDTTAWAHLRASAVYWELGGAQQKDTAAHDKDVAQAEAEIAKAVSLAQPGDPHFADYGRTAAVFAERRGDLVSAEKTLRDLYQQRPEDQAVRLDLSRVLAVRTSSRDEAIRILEQSVNKTAGQSDLRVTQAESLRQQTQLLLASLLLDGFDSTPPADRPTVLANIQKMYDQFVAVGGESVASLKLKGKIELARGQAIQALATFNRAINSYNGNEDDELLLLLARVYILNNQDTRAVDYLNAVVTRHPTYIPAQMQLAGLLVRLHDVGHAEPHLEFLEKTLPADPIVIAMRLDSLDKEKDKDKYREVFDRLPESTPQLMYQKSQVAMQLNFNADAVRLLSKVLEQKPTSVAAAILLSRAQQRLNQPDQARATLEQALKASPDNPDLLLADQQLIDPSPDKMRELRRQVILKETDPWSREFDLARLEADAGNLDVALGHLDAAIKLKPTDARPWDTRFTWLIAAGRWDDAAACIKPLRDANFDGANGVIYQFRLAMAQQQLKPAENLAQSLVNSYPDFAFSWLCLGQALAQEGMYDDARSKFNEAIQRQADNIDALTGLIQCNYRLGHPEEALRYIQFARDRFPHNQTFQELLIQNYIGFGHPEMAVPILQQQMKDNPDLPSPALNLATAYLETATQQLRAAQKTVAAQQLDLAIQTLKAAQTHWPDLPEVYSLLARCSTTAGNYDEGVQTLKQLCARDAWKDKPDAYVLLAQYELDAAHAQEAEADLRTALSKDPKRSDVIAKLAGLLSDEGHFDEALALLGDSPDLRAKRIEVDLAAGKIDPAVKEIQTALASHPPDSAQLLAQWAYINVSQGDLAGALDHVNQALAINPRMAAALGCRGRIRLEATPPDVEQATTDLLAARDLAPTNPVIHVALADADQLRNDSEGTIRELEVALQYAPMDKDIRLRLVRLYTSANPPRVSEAATLLNDILKNPRFQHDTDLLTAAANLVAQEGDFNQAVALIDAALIIRPDDRDLQRTELKIELGAEHYDVIRGQVDKYLKDSTTGPWWMYEMRGLARNKLSDRTGAMADLTQALAVAAQTGDAAAVTTVTADIKHELDIDDTIASVAGQDPSDIRWQLTAAQLYMLKGDSDGAIGRMDKIISKLSALPEDQQVSALRVADLMYTTAVPPLTDRAVDVERKLLKLRPNDIVTLNNLANRIVELNSSPAAVDEALGYSQRAMDEMKKSLGSKPEVLETYGWVQVLAGHGTAGIATLRGVVEANPTPEACYHLAEGYMRSSYPQRALDVIYQAEDLVARAGPQSPVDAGLKSRIDDLKAQCEAAVQKNGAQLSRP